MVENKFFEAFACLSMHLLDCLPVTLVTCGRRQLVMLGLNSPDSKGLQGLRQSLAAYSPTRLPAWPSGDFFSYSRRICGAPGFSLGRCGFCALICFGQCHAGFGQVADAGRAVKCRHAADGLRAPVAPVKLLPLTARPSKRSPITANCQLPPLKHRAVNISGSGGALTRCMTVSVRATHLQAKQSKIS